MNLVEKIFLPLFVVLLLFAFFPNEKAIEITLFLIILATLLWPATIWWGFDSREGMRFGEADTLDRSELKKTTGKMVKVGAISGTVLALIYFGSGMLNPHQGIDLRSSGIGEIFFSTLLCIGGTAVFWGTVFYFSTKLQWHFNYKHKVDKK